MPRNPTDPTRFRCDGCQTGTDFPGGAGYCIVDLSGGRVMCYPGCSGFTLADELKNVLAIGVNVASHRNQYCSHGHESHCNTVRQHLLTPPAVESRFHRKTLRDTFLPAEPHDSCPMFVGAWGVNHSKGCAWVKWNHARLASKSDGALDKPNKTSDVKATDADPLAHVHTFIRVSNSHDPICDTHQCVACGAQRGTCQFCLGRGVWKPLYTHSP